MVGDKVFFTSDGVHEKLLLREMREIAGRHDVPGEFVREGGATVVSRTPQDNFSIVAVFVQARVQKVLTSSVENRPGS